MTSPMLAMEDVKKYFPVKRSFLDALAGRRAQQVHAVDGVTLRIREGEVFALVGESGSGKTTLGKLGLRVYKPTSGSVIFEGRDISELRGSELQAFRLAAQMVYQDPLASLNPRVRVGDAVSAPLGFHRLGDHRERRKRSMDMLRRVGFDPPENFYARFPHELSGGQRQRICIARALILGPRLLVADEPVAMLDVSIRAQILRLLIDLKKEMNLTLLVITHDLAMAKYFADRVAIMYLGQIVESAERDEIFKSPLHPYTRALFSAIPIPDPEKGRDRQVISGEIPSPISPPSGCRFHTRCPFVFERCLKDEPRLLERGPDHFVSCHLYNA